MSQDHHRCRRFCSCLTIVTLAVASAVLSHFGVDGPSAWRGCGVPVDPQLGWPQRRSGWLGGGTLGAFENRPGCPHCLLVSDVPAWSGAATIRRYRNEVERGARAPLGLNDSNSGACGPGRRTGASFTVELPDRAKQREYLEFSRRIGPAPLEAALVAVSRPLSAMLFQRGSCGAAAQARHNAFECPLDEVRSATVGGVAISAAIHAADAVTEPSSTRRAPVGLLLHAPPMPATSILDDGSTASGVGGGGSRRGPGAHNIHHVLVLSAGVGSVWCVMQAAEELRRASVVGGGGGAGGTGGDGSDDDLRLIVDARTLHAMAAWKRQLLAALLPIWSPPPSSGGAANASSRGRRSSTASAAATSASPATISTAATAFRRLFQIRHGPNWGVTWSRFELDLAPAAPVGRMRSAVRAAMHMSAAREAAALSSPASPSPPTVLLLQRAKDRRLADVRTGTAAALLRALCARGLRVETAAFDGATPLRTQVRRVATASLLLSVHGAQLTNLVWLDPDSAVVEVLLRFGWCREQPWQRLRATGAPAAVLAGTARCVGYHKADYANLAHAAGVRYRYFDAAYLPPQLGSNPISRPYVLVDSDELALLAALMVEAPTEASQKV